MHSCGLYSPHAPTRHFLPSFGACRTLLWEKWDDFIELFARGIPNNIHQDGIRARDVVFLKYYKRLIHYLISWLWALMVTSAYTRAQEL